MELSSELVHQVFSLQPNERYQLAHQLLDSIEEGATADLDEEFVAELRRRRDEMLRGEETVADWRAALLAYVVLPEYAEPLGTTSVMPGS